MSRPDLTPLLAEGFAIVPIARGEKRPVHDGWLKRTFTIEDFEATQNVGVKCGAPSGHKVDVDLDAREAVRAADLLPITRVHGRAGKPHSHHWYVCTDLSANEAFKDPTDNVMLVELRGTGLQTVVPPSVHESGEPLVWENDRPFLPMAAPQLHQAVAEVATVSLLARHWPVASRHIAALHVGGLLARLGILPPQVARLVQRIAEIAGDEEVTDRTRAARESAEKQRKGEPTTGGASLAEMFEHGKAILRAIYGWFGHQGDDQMEALNAKHFVVQLGSAMVVGTEHEDGVVFQPFASFRERYCNQFIGKQSLGDVWLRHPKRREFDRVMFAPPLARWAPGPKDYNLWRGFHVEPDPAPHPEQKCERYLEHAERVIAAGNSEHARYVLDLMADVVQRPGRLVGKTLCLRGPQGVGKSGFIEPFGWIFGRRHFIVISSRDQLVGQFNGHLSSRVVVFADEAVWGGNKKDEGPLKRLVTQDTLTIRRLYTEAVMELNCVHLMMATNEHWPYPAQNLERRLVILDVAGNQSECYYEALMQETHTPGFQAALLATLLNRVVDIPRLRRGLDTKALQDVKQQSSHPVQQWWQQTLEDGTLTPGEPWPGFISTRVSYEQYCEDMGHRRAGAPLGTRGEFTLQLQSLLPGRPTSEQQRISVNVARPGMAPFIVNRPERGYKLQTLLACRAFFDQLTGSRHEWPNDEDEDAPHLREDA